MVCTKFLSIETITDEIVKAYSEVDGKRPALALVASDKVRSTYETSLIIEKPESIDSWSFYIYKKNNTPITVLNQVRLVH